MAFGPCLLTTAADYERGRRPRRRARRGRRGRRTSARAYRAAGLPVRCLGGGETCGSACTPTASRQLVEGWTKNLAAGAAGASPVAVAGAVCGWRRAAPVAAAGVVAGSVVAGAGAVPVAPALAWAVVALQLQLAPAPARVVPLVDGASLFPVPLLAFVALFAGPWSAACCAGR